MHSLPFVAAAAPPRSSAQGRPRRPGLRIVLRRTAYGPVCLLTIPYFAAVCTCFSSFYNFRRQKSRPGPPPHSAPRGIIGVWTAGRRRAAGKQKGKEPPCTRPLYLTWDGTLLNTPDDLARATACARDGGWPTHTEEFRYFVGNGIPKLIERLAPPRNMAPRRNWPRRWPGFQADYGARPTRPPPTRASRPCWAGSRLPA